MAHFPQGKTNVDKRCNTGERKVYHALKRCLSDDYTVWHNLPVGAKGLQPDFVILSPRQGLLVLEVKDWKHSTLVGATKDSVELDTPRGRVTDAHPMRQARDYAMALADQIRQDPQLVHGEGPFKGKLLFPYGWGVVMSGIKSAEVAGSDFDRLFPTNRTLLRDDLAEEIEVEPFCKRLWGMMEMAFPHTLTLPQRDRIRWHLYPELRVGGDQRELTFTAEQTNVSALQLAIPDLLQVMDQNQEEIARRMGEGHRLVHGVAGSGKTMLLVFRAKHLAPAALASGKPILVLCYNKALSGRIAQLLEERGVSGSQDGVVVQTFHGWCEDMVRTYQLNVGVPRSPPDRYYEALTATVERALKSGFVPAGQYTALMIDEAHDFQDSWIRMATLLVDPTTRSLLIMYDHAQSIYQRHRKKFSWASLGVEVPGRRSRILTLNYRNTAEVLHLAVRCAQSLLEPSVGGEDTPVVMPESAGRRGMLPRLMRAGSAQLEAVLVADAITGLISSGTGLHEIAVLYRAKYLMTPLERELEKRRIPFQSMQQISRMSQFDWGAASIKLLTLHSAKGLEFPAVFISALNAIPDRRNDKAEELRLVYIGITRATQALVLSAHGDSEAVSMVQEQVSALHREFATLG